MPQDIAGWTFTNNPQWGGYDRASWDTGVARPAVGVGGGGGGGGYSYGNLIGSPGTSGSGTPYGTVPQVPDPAVSLRRAQETAITALPGLEDLAKQLNTFQQGQIQTGLETALPGYAGATGTAMGNIASNLRGEIPADVMRQFQQDAAERGVGTGLPGAGVIDSGYLTNVLRNRLALQSQGQTQLNQRVGATPLAKPWDPSSFFITPAQMFQAQSAANIASAAPDPAAAAAAARQALQQGAQFGAGIGGGGGSGAFRFPGVGYGNDMVEGPGTIVAPSTGTGTMIGGTLYPQGGGPTENLGANWQNWVSGLGGPTTTGGGSYYAGDQAGYGGGEDWFDYFLGNEDTGSTPPGTVTTGTESYYDPYSEYYDLGG